ncbi:MAG: hypothetical protein AB1782_03360 [Cyanobacteriota bacterium]
MFKCTECDSVDNFSLMLSANYTGPGVFKQTYNEHGEIVINIDGFEFIPDLAFMNSHAVCKYCGTIHSFEYWFNKEAPAKKDFEDELNDDPDVDIAKHPEKESKKKKKP